MSKKTIIRRGNRKSGTFLPAILIACTILLILATAIITLMMANLKRISLYEKQVSTSSIAEAGLNYYLWHLAHNPNDYTDNHPSDTIKPEGYFGPYSHNYSDSTGHEIGTYDLYIYPPSADFSSVQVKSVGKVNGSTLEKTVVAQLSMPYFSRYYLLSFNDEIWIGDTEIINGPVHTNNQFKGIRNDGTVGQATATCIEDYRSDTDGSTHDCIWGPGTFTQGTDYPVSSFNVADVNFTNLLTDSQPDGTLYPENTSGVGYHVILKGDRYDIRKVRNANSNRGYYPEDNQQYNIFDTIRNENAYLADQPFPENGLIFINDNVWIEGTLTNEKVTFVAAKPSENDTSRFKNIYINNNLRYTEKNSLTKLGLVAQKHIQIVYGAPNNLNVDAAMLAKTGFIFYPYYSGNIKNSITVFGSLAHLGGLIFSWAYSNGTVVAGYRNTINNHDPELIFSPPPFFPKSGQYQILNWHEE